MNSEHVKLLLSGVRAWNAWEAKNPDVQPDLTRANLEGVNLEGANLTRANLEGANLEGVNLEGANLTRANLAWANLEGVNLTRANLTGANLAWANLERVNLEGVNLEGANLTRANLEGVNLEGVNLEGVIGNSKSILSIQTKIWMITYTAEVMQIGCQRHRIDKWWEFTDEEISKMDHQALKWWGIWKPILQQIIKANPATATATGYENKKELIP